MTNEQYYELITAYEDASRVMLTKLEILNHNIYRKNPQKPVHHIQNRIKSKSSMEEKLLRRGYSDSVISAKENLTDIAGIRVICYFTEEIYDLVTALKCQSDLILIQEKDYIKNPKANGYRSYHMIFGVPLYCMDAMEYFPVEIQFRTLAMDLWASMEHRVNYKKQRADKALIGPELEQYAKGLEIMEERFRELRDTAADTGIPRLTGQDAPDAEINITGGAEITEIEAVVYEAGLKDYVPEDSLT